MHAGKTGWVYVLDAATGKLVRKSDAFVPQENMFALPTDKGTRMLPGANGGSEWSPIAVDPTLDYAFVAALHQPMNYIVHTAPWEKGRLWLGSAFVAIPGEEQYGLFSAVDLKTGKIAWQNKVPQPMMGGSLATAGGLTFTGEGNGNFNAYNSKTGKLLWQFNAGAGCNSAPMTFTMGGEQFVAVACGGNFQISYPLGDALMVFGLPAKADEEVAASDGRQGPRVGAPLPADSFGRIVATRWWWAALGAGGFLAGRASAGPGPDRHWSARDGDDWRALGPEARMAYADGFLAGAGFAQAAARGGGFRGAAGHDGGAAPERAVPVSLRRQRLRHPRQRLLLVGESPSAPHLVRFLGGEHIAHWSDD